MMDSTVPAASRPGLRQRALSSKFVRDVVMLGGGTAGAQLIAILFLPVMSRIYSPENFGAFNLMVSIVLLLAPICTFRYEMMIMLARTEAASRQLVWLIIALSAMAAIGTFAVLWPLHHLIAEQLNVPGIHLYWIFVPVVLFLVGVYEALRYWVLRHRRFATISQSMIARSALFSCGASVIWFVPGFHAVGLLVAYALGEAGKCLALMRSMRPRSALGLGRPRIRHMAAMARRYFSRASTLTASTCLSSVYDRLPHFIIGAFYGAAALGFYAMVERLLSLGSQLVAGAIGDVYRQRAAELHRTNGQFGELTRSTLLTTGLIAVVPFGIAIGAAPYLFTVLLGATWAPAGHFASVMLLGEFLAFVINPVAHATVIVGATHYVFWINLLRLLATLLLLPAMHLWDIGIYQFLYALVGIRVVIVLTEGWVSYRCAATGRATLWR
jgi:O-antigen/teichoic acid export membrane protein